MKCLYCGRMISQLANDGNICTSPINISNPDTVGNRHHVTLANLDENNKTVLDEESKQVRKMMKEGDTEGLAAYCSAGNKAKATAAAERVRQPA